ncbi:MAG TPA: Ig-like domain-containing protein, partial [Gemmataceae bacterium]|nr:Ig-like domain-containing protein [Gemmataceae bacterium]
NAGSPVAVSTAAGVTSASFSTAALATGTHTIIAIYSGDANFTSSFANLPGGQIIVNKPSLATTTTVSSSASASVFGQGVTFMAIIGFQSSGGGTPTGTVQFQIDGSNVGSPVSVRVASGVVTASFNSATLAVGSHAVTAIYGGDSNFAPSSGVLAGGQTVNQAGTIVAVTASALSSVYGQIVTFTALIGVTSPGAGTPTGMVQFQIDGANFGSPVAVSTSGGVTTASFSTVVPAVGAHTLTAVYSGDGNLASSSGSVTQTVAKASTSLVITSSASPSVSGQTVTFTATIGIMAPGAGAPTGTVQFQVDGTNLGSPTNVSTSGGVTTATFSTATLPLGMHTITASYSGDADFTGSTGSLVGGQTITTTSNPPTTTTISSRANPAVFGQTISFTATVSTQNSGGTPTGVVQFQIDGSNVGSPVTVTTIGGVTTATFSTATLAVGSHTVTAFYSGDNNFAASIGSLANGQTVAKADTSMVVTSSASPSVSGQGVTFTATISVQAPGSGTPTGTVQFQIDGSNVGSPVSVSTTGGVTAATFSSTTLTVGSHTITASYSGDGNLTGSTGTLAGGEVITGGAAGNVTATLDLATGLLRISGDTGNNVLTITQVAGGGLQVAGVGTTVNQSTNAQSFGLVTGLTIALLNGNDSVTLSQFSLPGNITLTAGSGADVLSLDTVLANALSLTTAGPGKDTISLSNTSSSSLIVSAGDNASFVLNGVSSGSIKLTAGSDALVNVQDITSASDLSITLGDNTQGVTVKASSVASLNLLQTGSTGNPSFDLENDSIRTNLTLTAGAGNNTIVLSHLQIGVQLLVALGAGKNTVTADHVTALFGTVDGGMGGTNTYVDGGGNAGYVVFHFLGH